MSAHLLVRGSCDVIRVGFLEFTLVPMDMNKKMACHGLFINFPCNECWETLCFCVEYKYSTC